MTALLAGISIGAAIVLSLAVLLARHPRTAVIALIMGSFFTFPLFVFSMGYNSGVLVTDVVLFATLVRWLTSWSRCSHTHSTPGRGVMLGLFALIVLSRMIVLARFPSIKGMNQFGFYSLRAAAFLLLFALPASVEYSRRDVARVLNVAGFGIAALACAGILQYLGVVDFAFSTAWLVGGREASSDAAEPLHSFLLGYNRRCVGLVMSLGVFVGIAITSLSQGAIKKLLGPMICCLAFMCLIGSHSRSGLLGLVGGLALMVIFLKPQQWIVLGTLAVSGAGIIVLLFGEQLGFSERFGALTSTGEFSVSSGGQRVYEWGNIAKRLVSHPTELVFGIGFLNFASYYRGYLFVTVLHHAHNLYLHVLTELGIFGALLFFWWILSHLKTIGRAAVRRDQENWRRLLFGAFVGTLGLVFAGGLGVESLYPMPSSYPFVQTYLPILGMVVSFASRRTSPLQVSAASYGRPLRT